MPIVFRNSMVDVATSCCSRIVITCSTWTRSVRRSPTSPLISLSGTMPEFRVLDTLHDIDKQQWDTCFPEEVENYDYLLAIEESAIAGFSFRYLTAWRGRIMQSAAPLFLNDYSLDTTLQGVGKTLTTRIKHTFPKLMTLRLACIGSPCTERGLIGFHPELDEQERQLLFAETLVYFETYAASQACRLLGVKDIPESFQQRFSEQLLRAK